jgi:methylated-DNA-[protein]-cysteine S-methyltransferase
MAGNPRAYRAAGNAAHRNPHPVVVPCHRVVQSDGRIGGYGGGVRKKIRLLAKEGVVVRKGRVDLGIYGWKI